MTATQAMTRHVLRTLTTRQPLMVQNALLRGNASTNLEELSVAQAGVMKWYSCGPTVYDEAHLGHARAYVTLDILRRLVTTFAATAVDYALGVTDIDDKIIDRASELNTSPRSLARQYEAQFFEDMAALNVLPPTRVLRVTEHLPEISALIHGLENVDAAYAAPSGNVYFSVQSRGDRYHQLDPSRGKADSSIVEDIGEKRDSRDFALWKRSTGADDLEARWPSRWGVGRPGWHVECSAMSIHALGEDLDMHTGGIDLRFPHHTNELATAEAYLDAMGDQRWAHTWLHVGHLHIQGQKMSKSLKNFVSIRDFIKSGGNADVFRVFCLAHRYSAAVEYSQDRAKEAEAFLRKVRRFVQRDQVLLQAFQDGAHMTGRCEAAHAVWVHVRKAVEDVDRSVADDFDTPGMLRIVADVVSQAEMALTSSPRVPEGDDSEGLSRRVRAVSGDAALAYEQARRVVVDVLTAVGVSREGVGITPFEGANGKTTRNVDDAVEALVTLRAGVRIAAQQKDIGAVLKACDEAREVASKRLGVRISDKADGGSIWEWTG